MNEIDIEQAKRTVDEMLRYRKEKMQIVDCLAISAVLKELERLQREADANAADKKDA